jgi:hypothetical protein
MLDETPHLMKHDHATGSSLGFDRELELASSRESLLPWIQPEQIVG